ncbi:helix-turn-helix transcriptional regulator, partial [Bradyrhizobium sp. IC4060]|uniref:helix-turn-helix domain-containing protein n=1 Tax=Bradyrhizobium sp. IC4060 TaxID=2793807 RepID=UPI001CD55AA7
VRALFAARLVQARELRALSQRALGDRMGLGKQKGSSRINRYEHQRTAIGFDNLEALAKILNVPPAYLLADNATMAAAILALGNAKPRHQDDLTQVLGHLCADPTLTRALLKVLARAQPKSKDLRESLNALAKDVTKD